MASDFLCECVAGVQFKKIYICIHVYYIEQGRGRGCCNERLVETKRSVLMFYAGRGNSKMRTLKLCEENELKIQVIDL